MKKLIGFFLVAFPFFIFSQSNIDFSEIDNHAINAPSSSKNSVKDLTKYLLEKAETDLEKTRAIFMWMTENIRYDVTTYFGSRISAEEHARRQEIKNVLRSRKAVCQGYAKLFDKLCAEMGVKSEKVTGYTKIRRNQSTRSEHAWNIVRIENQWYLIDVTWGAGTVNMETRKYKKNRNEDYFLANPESFLEDHFPHDPVFQLVTQPITMNDFDANQTTSSQKSLTFSDMYQTLNNYSKLKTVASKEIDSARRILKFDPKSPHAKYQLAANYFKQASNIYDDYRTKKISYMGKERQLTDEILDDWEQDVQRIKRKLRSSRKLVQEIQPGTQYFKFGLNLKKSAKEFETFLGREQADILKLRQWLSKK